jgi:hypothetical protein
MLSEVLFVVFLGVGGGGGGGAAALLPPTSHDYGSKWRSPIWEIFGKASYENVQFCKIFQRRNFILKYKLLPVAPPAR